MLQIKKHWKRGYVSYKKHRMAMKTPVNDFISEYENSGFIRFHMPGHKGRILHGLENRDITEIRGADYLYEAEGIIAESEAFCHFI